MVDGFKIHTVVSEAERTKLENKFEFIPQVGTVKGSEQNIRLKAKYRETTMTLVGDKHLTIQGSLHKSFNNGVNYDAFTYTQVVAAIETMTKELCNSAERWKIQRLEIGVNITATPISFKSIEQNAIIYKLKPFQEYKMQQSCFGIYAMQQRYCLKIYAKSKQVGLSYEIIRFELKIIKSAHIKNTGVQFLSDLLSQKCQEQLGKLLGKHMSDILFNHHEIMSRCKLTEKEQKLYLQGCNPQYWKQLKSTSTSSLVTSRLRSFTTLLRKHAGVPLAEVLASCIASQWQQLLHYENNKN